MRANQRTEESPSVKAAESLRAYHFIPVISIGFTVFLRPRDKNSVPLSVPLNVKTVPMLSVACEKPLTTLSGNWQCCPHCTDTITKCVGGAGAPTANPLE